MVWSSSRMMQHMILSQMAYTKLNMKMLHFKFTAPEKPLTTLINDFLQPFSQFFETRNLKVEVIELNCMPEWANIDMDLYMGILFHLV